MRTRKSAAQHEAPRDDVSDVFPPDDAGVMVDDAGIDEVAPISEASTASGRICLDCGGSGGGSAKDGCVHRELARLHGPSRTATEAVARLRRAAAEHRAAARALRSLLLSEVARGRAELESTPEPEPIAAREEIAALPAPAEPAIAPPCARCAARDAEAPIATGGTAGEPADAGGPVDAARPATNGASRGARRRAKVPVAQQALPFLSEPEPPTT